MICAIAQRHPKSVVALADAVGVPLPEHDDVASAPDSHLMQGGDTVYTDATVRLLRNGVPVFFATVEMQRRFERGKYVTLHAYHGSGVRNTDSGGHVFVLSDKASAAERFRAEETARRAELAFAASFHSGHDLKPLEEAELPLGARALPAANIVLDGEAIVFDETGRPRPFQVTMRRFGRRLDVQKLRGELPIGAFFFDCLGLDGSSIAERPLSERYRALTDAIPSALRMPRLVTTSEAEAQGFYEAALEA